MIDSNSSSKTSPKVKYQRFQIEGDRIFTSRVGRVQFVKLTRSAKRIIQYSGQKMFTDIF